MGTGHRRTFWAVYGKRRVRWVGTIGLLVTCRWRLFAKKYGNPGNWTCRPSCGNRGCDEGGCVANCCVGGKGMGSWRFADAGCRQRRRMNGHNHSPLDQSWFRGPWHNRQVSKVVDCGGCCCCCRWRWFRLLAAMQWRSQRKVGGRRGFNPPLNIPNFFWMCVYIKYCSSSASIVIKS